MAKVSALTTAVTIAGNAISNDVTSLSLDTPYGVQDVTGLDKIALERIMLRADASGTINGVFNTAASMSHATFKTPGSKTFVIAFAAAAATATFTAVTTNYAISLGADGSLTWSVNFALSSGTAVAWT
ncbi:hypothetical protein UFOVP1028_37 [uncultured Caudovirales phage]|uniref:Uncharacterized protein n=1 Tax=uncultured Caudovirales phage TaxID=2100421 RepID=A0A6J5PNW6_9CAUD|nr:hypothetical protein UFOVP960_2 [uncultured Caudovirales phage]CAB4179109.1 hypothetical protein UFOVP1028_37 [uncultured Caudovirales phage]CAB4189445.1 hypothetical protein UFOVP1187_28 [uncultured Caudovirales phage]CAB4192538.1 hypothetical protein UFOVP1235_45 [uncultured Caudovirales phage]CAB4215875.1 hypothetical protein UFOVP1488_28 [uncultured Caudovirales phage]